MPRQKTKDYRKELNEVYTFVNNHFKVDIADRKRSNHYVALRALYFRIASETTLATYEAIAEVVNRDHSTFIHAKDNLFDYIMSNTDVKDAYNVYFGIETEDLSHVTMSRLRQIVEEKKEDSGNNVVLTKNEIAYRKLTDSQKSVYDQRAELILKSFNWKEYNSTFETIEVGISSN